MANLVLLHKFFKNFALFLIVFLAIFINDISIKNSYAGLYYGVERIRGCNPTTGDPDGIDWNIKNGGKDAEFVMNNPICLAIATTSYISVKAAIFAMNKACGNITAARFAPSILRDAMDIVKCARKTWGNPACIAGWSTAVGSLGVFLGQMKVIQVIASETFNSTYICGSEWYKPNVNGKTITTPNRKADIQNDIESYARLEDGEERKSLLSFDNKYYREWYFGGVEIEDNISDDWDNTGNNISRAINVTGTNLATNQNICRDVVSGAIKRNYDDYPPQKYYLRGLESGNYNCGRYLSEDGVGDPIDGSAMPDWRRQQLNRAYECCKSRSREYICIHNKGTGIRGEKRIFCKVGSKCTINDITYEAKYIDNNRLICAQTWSLCPYNFSIRGGTEFCDYYKDGIYNSKQNRWDMIQPADIEKGFGCDAKSEIRNEDCTLKEIAGRCKNYCQYLSHCTTVSNSEFNYNTSIASPYFSSACLNFVGDSKNRVEYSGGIVFGAKRHFSAPIVQCTKETLENLFHNRAGHTRCLRDDEYASKDGICASGKYIYQKDMILEQESFFSSIQRRLKGVVKMILVLSVMFYGMNLLMGKSDIREKKDILIYFIKIGLVMYFAVGSAWQTTFFEGVYGSSAELSRMVFKIKADQSEQKQDGCQFGIITDVNGDKIASSSTRIYPEGKEYLAVWDTLDCKLARYLGFGPGASVSNIVMLIFAGFFTGAIGLYFSLALLFVGIFFLALIIRMMHIFLSSVISIVLMVFLSPITIPMLLFKRTEGIFKGWLTNLISFCVQPMILFAYIAIVVMVIDKALIGSATFYGPGPVKSISCKEVCINGDGSLVDDSAGKPMCDQKGQKLLNPMNDSVACLVGADSFGKFPGFEIIGISIPIIKEIFKGNVKEIILTLLKGALIMYLLYKIADQIPGITSTIIGGTPLPSANPSGGAMFKKIKGFARGVQKRANRGMVKYGKEKAKSLKDDIRDRTTQGKSVDNAPEENKGATTTNDSQGSGGVGGDEER